MSLRHGSFGSVYHIVHELGAVRKLHISAIDVIHTFVIDQEEVVAAITPCYISVFPQLDILRIKSGSFYVVTPSFPIKSIEAG